MQAVSDDATGIRGLIERMKKLDSSGQLIDDWGEPIKYGPREMESEVHKIGNIPVRLTWYRGKLAGVEYWLKSYEGCGVGNYYAVIDPERPWLRHE